MEQKEENDKKKGGDRKNEMERKQERISISVVRFPVAMFPGSCVCSRVVLSFYSRIPAFSFFFRVRVFVVSSYSRIPVFSSILFLCLFPFHCFPFVQMDTRLLLLSLVIQETVIIIISTQQ